MIKMVKNIKEPVIENVIISGILMTGSFVKAIKKKNL